jgi:hypothetical protein
MVESQNILGISSMTQFAWLRLTMYALVRPANIIMMLPMATHKVNLWGCILFRCTLITLSIAKKPFYKTDYPVLSASNASNTTGK